MLNGPGAMQEAVAARRTQIGGDWFFWIAGYSVVNTLLAQSSMNLRFALGLGTTELLDSLAGTLGRAGVLGLDVLAAAFYVLCGFFARRGARWAFLVGMVFFALDAGLLLLMPVKDWISIAFHGYALFRIFQGFQAAQQLAALRAQSARGYAPPASGDVWPPPPSA